MVTKLTVTVYLEEEDKKPEKLQENPKTEYMPAKTEYMQEESTHEKMWLVRSSTHEKVAST